MDEMTVWVAMDMNPESTHMVVGARPDLVLEAIRDTISPTEWTEYQEQILVSGLDDATLALNDPDVFQVVESYFGEVEYDGDDIWVGEAWLIQKKQVRTSR